MCMEGLPNCFTQLRLGLAMYPFTAAELEDDAKTSELSMEAPQTKGLAANDDADHRSPSPDKKAVTFGEASYAEPPPGLELGDSSPKGGAEAQPGLQKDEPLKPPPEGKGRRVLRPEELKGLPEGIDVECPTDNIEEDFKIFKQKTRIF